MPKNPEPESSPKPQVSDDEGAPAEISFQTAKELAQEEEALVKGHQLAQKRVLKLKRQMRHQANLEQKQKVEKRSKKRKSQEPDSDSEPLFPPELILELRQESSSLLTSLPAPAPAQSPAIQIPKKKPKSTTRVYSELGIEVKTFSSVPDSRGLQANLFKTKRLYGTKVHRERVDGNGSYEEKLRAAGKMK